MSSGECVVLRAYGLTVALRGPGSALSAARDALPPSFRPVDAVPDREWEVRGGDELESSVRLALSELELWVAEHARKRIFIHAGCVVFEGRAVVLPGRSMTGKSSLTAALVRAGGTYYSDEFAVLDSGGVVRPYARPLSLRPYEGGPPRQVPAKSLGGRVGRGPAPVGLVASLAFDSAAGWSVEPLTPGQAALRLMDNAVAARSRPRAVLTALGAAVETSEALAGTRGDADEAAGRLVSRLMRQ